MEQINLFEQIEKVSAEEQRKEKVRGWYMLWKRIPEILPFQKEHLTMYNVFSPSPVHICEAKPKGESIWWNVGESQKDNEYWVWSRESLCGEVVKECPYCKANLAGGFGARYSLRWKRGETFYKEKSVREYYNLDKIDEEDKRSA